LAKRLTYNRRFHFHLAFACFHAPAHPPTSSAAYSYHNQGEHHAASTIWQWGNSLRTQWAKNILTQAYIHFISPNIGSNNTQNIHRRTHTLTYTSIHTNNIYTHICDVGLQVNESTELLCIADALFTTSLNKSANVNIAPSMTCMWVVWICK